MRSCINSVLTQCLLDYYRYWGSGEINTFVAQSLSHALLCYSSILINYTPYLLKGGRIIFMPSHCSPLSFVLFCTQYSCSNQKEMLFFWHFFRPSGIFLRSEYLVYSVYHFYFYFSVDIIEYFFYNKSKPNIYNVIHIILYNKNNNIKVL